MKTLANCSLAEFLRQTNKIRKEVAVFLDQTKILDIRKVLPDLKECKTEEEKREKIQKQSKENISNMLDAMLEENADATVRLLGLLCFKEGEELEELNPVDVIGVVLEILSSKRVLDFFTSLMQSGLINMANTSQK